MVVSVICIRFMLFIFVLNLIVIVDVYIVGYIELI